MAKSSVNKGSNNRFLIFVIVFVAALVFVAFATFTQKIFETETYYVLNQDVPVRTRVVPEMMEPITTSKDTSPAAAISLDEIQMNGLYTKFPLKIGDILTQSNVGSLDDISVGVPDTWVVTNFSVGADDAVGGRIQRGIYFDMMVVTADGAYYPFINVLTLDTTVNMGSASSAEAVDTEEAHAGQTTQYVVGMTPENAAKLQDIMANSNGKIKLLLSPRANEYQKPALASYEGLFSYEHGEDGDGPIWPGAGPDGREITDYTFTDIERDEFGVPIGVIENCSVGNSKVSGDACVGHETPATEAPATAENDAAVTSETTEGKE